MSSSQVWHAQNGLWRRLGGNPISPGQTTGKPLIGGAISSQQESDWEAFEGQVGTLAIRRSYAGLTANDPNQPVLPATFAASNAGIDVDKRESVWSFKAVPSLFAAGNNDTWFSSFLDSIPAGHKTIIILWHEPEGEIGNGQFTLAQWKAANNHMGAMVHAKGRSELRSAICIIGTWEYDPASQVYGQDMWDPGFATNIDYIGFDPYDINGNFTDLTDQPEFVEAMNWAAGHNKPVLLPEFGCEDDPGGDPTKKATFIQHTYQMSITDNMYAILYFNFDNGGGSAALTTPESIAAFASINADSKVS